MTQPRQMGLRLYLCASGLTTALVSIFDDQSPLPHTVLTSQGWLGVLLLAFLCLFGIADVIVNDVMSSKWSIPCAALWRNDGYLALAAVNIAFVFALASKNSEGWFMLRYIIDALAAAYTGYKDVQIRYIQPRQEARQHAERHP